MKKLFFTLCLILGVQLLQAQPVISYIIPDIGVPGKNTYVEVIGPYNASANFGVDGVYLNNPGDNIRLKCVNDNDTNKIKIGPLSVSWNGRMISAQFFVLPHVNPNSDDWDLLNADFKIPI